MFAHVFLYKRNTVTKHNNTFETISMFKQKKQKNRVSKNSIFSVNDYNSKTSKYQKHKSRYVYPIKFGINIFLIV